MIHRETHEAYHARRAVSASFLWDIVKPGGCLAQAWFDSVFNSERPPQKHSHELDIGTAAHLAVLENHEFAARCSLIAYDNYRTKEARDLRDECYVSGRVPLLPKDYDLINNLRKSLQNSDASELLFGAGESEVSFTWESYPDDAPISIDHTDPFAKPVRAYGLACKARADRIVPDALVDLKTAVNASDEAFRYACMRDGHHLRAAWYLDGWREQESVEAGWTLCDVSKYRFVVIGKEQPHLVGIKQLDERAIEWGKRLYRRALAQFRRGRETGIWSGYNREGENANIVSLPVSAEYRYAEMEAEGEL